MLNWFSRRAKPGVERVEAAVLPGSGDVALRYPGEGVPRIISAVTAQAIADAVNLRRRLDAGTDATGAPAPAPAG